MSAEHKGKLYSYSSENMELVGDGDIYAYSCTLLGQNMRKNKTFYLDITGSLRDVLKCKVVDYIYPYTEDPVVTGKQGSWTW